MQPYLDKFNESLKGKQNIDIELFNDEPLSMKYVRHNQGGKACYRMLNSNVAHQKTKDGWQDIECNANCQYRQKDANGKCACNRIGCLKFLIPSICEDRIFYMQITSQTSLDRLHTYFQFQKDHHHPLMGQYNLFLKQEEQITASGKTFTNYIVDIRKNLISTTQTPQLITQNTNQNMTTNVQNTVNSKSVVKEQAKQVTPTTTNAEKKVQETQKEKTTKSKTTSTKATKKAENSFEKKTPEENTTQTTSLPQEFSSYYILMDTFREDITNKKGETKNYLIGNFYDTTDTQFNIVIKPENEAEILECGEGTVVKPTIKEIGSRKFAISLEFIDKRPKKIAA